MLEGTRPLGDKIDLKSAIYWLISPTSAAACQRSSKSNRFGEDAGTDRIKTIIATVPSGAPVTHLVDEGCPPYCCMCLQCARGDDGVESVKNALVLVLTRDMLDHAAAQAHRIYFALQNSWQKSTETIGFDGD